MASGNGDAGMRRLGIDVGGTFTDFVLLDVAGGRIVTHKELTTPHDPAAAILEGVRTLVADHGVDPATAVVIHGTTLVSNAVIERRGAKVALVTTAGMRDVIATGTENRYDITERLLSRPAPLVDRDAIFELDERMLASGDALKPVDDGLIGEVVDWLRARDVEAVGICLLHADRFPEHERRVLDALDRELDIPVAASHEVAPEIREYQRASTTVANAYVQPLMRDYLGRLADELERVGYARQLYVMLSDGAVTTVTAAARFPIRLVESGAAGGVQAAAHFGRAMGERRLLSFDMGGTTAKLAVLDDHEPVRTSSVEVARVHRFKKGSGFPLLMPVIELLEIGAGGGSIAAVDGLGLLKVGPRSAGADPGPVCYGGGGQEPTVTDAAVALGYVNPEFFLGGRMRLDRDGAVRAIDERLAGPLGVDVTAAALGIVRVATESMAAAARVYLAEHGRDARRYSLIAFGGAGPMFACRLARALRIDEVLIPSVAGTASALGFISAPVAFESSRTFLHELDRLEIAALSGLVDELTATNLRLLADAGVTAANATSQVAVDMRYRAQTHEVEVHFDATPTSREQLATAFDAAYRELYGRALSGRELELVRCRVRTTGARPEAANAAEAPSDEATPQGATTRRVVFEDGIVEDCPVHHAPSLAPGDVVVGPAIVEAVGSTAVLEPGARGVLDESRCLRIVVNGGSR